ncbi:MAG: hypothetical protein AAB365_03685 [Patescibacteria group bacterium]
MSITPTSVGGLCAAGSFNNGKRMKTKHVMFIMLCIGIALGINSWHDHRTAKQTPQPTPAVEETPAQEESTSVPLEPPADQEAFLHPELTETADTSVTITGQKGGFAFESTSSSNQTPAVIPESQIRELIQAQQRMAAAQK